MVKKIFKFLGIALIVFVVSLLAIRLFFLNTYPNSAKGIVKTDALSQSYNAGTLDGLTWKLPSEVDTSGDFFMHEPIYFANEKTLIVTIRYNNSFLKEQKFEGNGEEMPIFPSLYIYKKEADAERTDSQATTAQAETDEREYEEALPLTYSYSYAFGLYSYRRYVFENVSLDNCSEARLYIYLNEERTKLHTSAEIYNDTRKMKNYSLKSYDKSRLS